jgi:hypothetical protein
MEAAASAMEATVHTLEAATAHTVHAAVLLRCPHNAMNVTEKNTQKRTRWVDAETSHHFVRGMWEAH